MSRLVFEAIGYGGACTDYGTPGWPVRMHRATLAEPKPCQD